MHYTACLDAFSNVIECVFLLHEDNVIHQALLDLLEARFLQAMHNIRAPNSRFPLDTLTIHYGRTSSVCPLSNANKNQIT
jgi:hypothetical protein